MNLENESGNFFESGISLPVGQRKWPHFIDFEIEDSYEGSRVNYGKTGGYPKQLQSQTIMGLELLHQYQTENISTF